VGKDKSLQQHLISALHDPAVGGHSGMPVTYKRMKQVFAWKGMKKDAQQFVYTC
jgi:hypothetical protein